METGTHIGAAGLPADKAAPPKAGSPSSETQCVSEASVRSGSPTEYISLAMMSGLAAKPAADRTFGPADAVFAPGTPTSTPGLDGLKTSEAA